MIYQKIIWSFPKDLWPVEGSMNAAVEVVKDAFATSDDENICSIFKISWEHELPKCHKQKVETDGVST